MRKTDSGSVTIRVRVGDSEIEVTGPKAYVEKKIDEYLRTLPKAIHQQPKHPSSQSSAATESSGKKISPA